MKKNYFIPALLLGLSFNVSVLAQPTINGADVNPIIGQSTISHAYNYGALTPGAGGAGVTWNYAGIGNTGNSTTDVLLPSSTPNGSQFANANTAFYVVSGGFYQYFLCNSNEYLNYGAFASGTSIPYSNPETIFTYPLAYNSTGSDNFYSTFTSSGYLYYRYGTSSFHADGYGTLVLPYGTLTDVLRVKLVEDYVDSTNVGGSPYVTVNHNDEYIWMKAGTHAFLLEYYTITSGANSVTAGFYLDQSSVGINEDNGGNLSFSVFPNPTTDVLNLKFELKNNSKVEVNLVNVMGQNMLNIISEQYVPGFYTKKISVAHLPKGVYMLHFLTDGYAKTSSIVLN